MKIIIEGTPEEVNAIINKSDKLGDATINVDVNGYEVAEKLQKHLTTVQQKRM